MRDFKNFRGGGMDTDSDVSLVAVNDFLKSYNIRVTGTQEGEEGEVTNIESTTVIAALRHAGINFGLGADKFSVVRKAYGVIYNSQGFHQLIELDYDTLTEDVLFENKTDSNGVDILPLDPRMSFNDIRLIQDKILILTDNHGEVYYINLERLKSGQFAYTTAEDIVLIQAQPLKEPTFVYNNDAGKARNLLANRLFQFRTQLEKYDFRFTAWSTISKRNVPIDEPTPVIGTDVTKNNNLIVSVDAGTDRTVRINVAARYDLLDWFMVKSIDRTTVIALPNTSVDVANEIYEAYDPSTNIYSFAFYNDGNYNNIDVLETDLNYDHVPRWCGALEDIQGSLIILGDITEGYERPTVDVSISVSAYDPLISRTDPPVDSLRVTNVTNERRDVFAGPQHTRLVTVTYAGLPKTGDTLYIRLRDIRNAQNTLIYPYTVPSTQLDNRAAVLASFSATVPQSSISGDTLTMITTPYFELDAAFIDLQNAGTGASKSIHCLKTNSSYQLALTHCDQYGRDMPLASDERFVIKTQSYAQTLGLIPQIDWQILSAPPIGAASAQWMISVNNTHQTDLYVSGIYDPAKSDADYLVFNISSLVKFNETNTSSILNYEWSSGDRCTFQFTYYSTNTPLKWFNAPSIDVEVVGLDIVPVTGPPETNIYYLKVRKSSALVLSDITGVNIMLEVYSPKKRTVTTDGVTTLSETLFFEFGERIGITNGQYDQTSGTIRDGDAYFKTRSYVGSTDSVLLTFTVEDFNFSDFYKSNYTSYGRARLYDDEQGQTRKKASIRYSDKYITGSRVNGLNRFYGERIYGEGDGETSSSKGIIGKLRVRDNYIVCLQELAVGHIPVNMSIVEDQAEQRQYAISDKLLNYIRYISNFGIGTAKESFGQSQNGTMFFIDPNNSLPIRDGYDGVKVIAGKNMKYFRKVLKRAKAEGRKIIGYYDDYNNEWNVSIEIRANIVTNFKFDTANWLFVDGYVIDPDTITITVESHGSVVLDGGNATFTPDTDYIGQAGFIFTFTDGVDTITKNICITVEAGTVTPDPFYFIDLLGQPLSTLLESNAVLISGINIPVPISITGGEYSINGGAWTSSAGTVSNNDTVKVRTTSSASQSTTVSATLTVSSYSDSFDITTFGYYEVTDMYGISGLTSDDSCTIGTTSQTLYTKNPSGTVGVGDWFYISDGMGGYDPFITSPIGGGDPDYYWVSYMEAEVPIWVKLQYGSGTGPSDGADIIVQKGNCPGAENVTLVVNLTSDEDIHRILYDATLSEALDNDLDVMCEFNYEDFTGFHHETFSFTITAGDTTANGTAGTFFSPLDALQNPATVTNATPNPNGTKTIIY